MSRNYGVRLQLVGAFGFFRDNTIVPMSGNNARLLALLALRGVVDRLSAAAMLWGDLESARAQANLRTLVWRINTIEPSLVVTSGDTLALDEDVDVDVRRLKAWARHALQRGDGDDDDEPFPLDIDPCGELLTSWDDEFVADDREQLRTLVTYAFEVTGRRKLLRGHVQEAAWYASQAARMDPYRESAVHLRVEASLRLGNRAEALQLYRRFRALLREELGVEPNSELTALIRNDTTGGQPAGGRPGPVQPARNGTRDVR